MTTPILIRPGVALTVLAAAILLIGCDSNNAAVVSSEVDSAGIAITTSAPPKQVDTLTLDPTWSVVSSAQADDQYMMEVSDLAMTVDGRLVVASYSTRSVVLLNNDGTVAWQFGREGEGPGEFQGSLSLATIGDTIFASDFNTRRITKITSEGTLAGVVQLEFSDPNLGLRAALPDGRLLFTSRHLLGPTEGINRDSVVYLTVKTDGTKASPIGWGRYHNVDFVMGEFGPNLQNQALGPTGALAMAGEGLVHTDGASAQLVRLDPNGATTQMIRWEEAAAPITEADRNSFAEQQRSVVSDEFERMKLEEWLEQAIWPATMPLTGLMAGGSDGTVLVERHCDPLAAGCAWLEFDPDGAWTRTVWIPVHAEMAVIRGDRLITLSNDELGHSQLAAWRLR